MDGPVGPLATSLFGDVGAALREHDPATLTSTGVTLAALTEYWVCDHRDLRSRGITHGGDGYQSHTL
jgi:hypothetical protein